MRSDITVVTCTKNRRELIECAYNSLVGQSVPPDVWLVIDNNSNDGTKEFIDSIVNNGLFEVLYIFEKNNGKHYALNAAFANLRTKYFLLLDDDDTLLPGAVEVASLWWNCLSIFDEGKKFSAITFNEIDKNGVSISSRLPSPFYVSSHIDVYMEDRYMGDRTQVFRSELFKNYLYPTLDGCDYMTDGYAWFDISLIGYKELYIDYPVKIKEYLSSGLTKSTSLRKRNLILLADYYFLLLRCSRSMMSASVALAHLIDCGISLKDIFTKCNDKWKLLALPLAIARYLNIKHEKK